MVQHATLDLAISQGKVGEELGDGSSRRKYCTICEIYFSLCAQRPNHTMSLLQQYSTLSIEAQLMADSKDEMD